MRRRPRKTTATEDFILVPTDTGADTDFEIHKTSDSRLQLIKNLERINSVGSIKDHGSWLSPSRRWAELQQALRSFTDTFEWEPVRGRRPFNDLDFVSFHPADSSIYDGKWSVPNHYTVRPSIVTWLRRGTDEVSLLPRISSSLILQRKMTIAIWRCTKLLQQVI